MSQLKRSARQIRTLLRRYAALDDPDDPDERRAASPPGSPALSADVRVEPGERLTLQ